MQYCIYCDILYILRQYCLFLIFFHSLKYFLFIFCSKRIKNFNSILYYNIFIYKHTFVEVKTGYCVCLHSRFSSKQLYEGNNLRNNLPVVSKFGFRQQCIKLVINFQETLRIIKVISLP
jgi:hypothetical protein